MHPELRSRRYVESPSRHAVRRLEGDGPGNRLPSVETTEVVAVRGDDEEHPAQLPVESDAAAVASDAPDQPVTGSTSIKEVVTRGIHETCGTRVSVRPGKPHDGCPDGVQTRAKKGSERAPRGRPSDSLPSRPGTVDPTSTMSGAGLRQVFGLVDAAPGFVRVPVYSPLLPDGVGRQ